MQLGTLIGGVFFWLALFPATQASATQQEQQHNTTTATPTDQKQKNAQQHRAPACSSRKNQGQVLRKKGKQEKTGLLHTALTTR